MAIGVASRDGFGDNCDGIGRGNRVAVVICGSTSSYSGSVDHDDDDDAVEGAVGTVWL